MTNFFTSLTRTYVPIIVGAFAAWLITVGIELDANSQAGLIVALTGLLQGVYYLVVRLLERKFPQLGVLLGSTQKPVYIEQTSATKTELK